MDFYLLLAVDNGNNVMVESLLVILTTGLIASLLCRQFSLPSLMGYMVTGIAIGPSALGLIRAGVGDIEHVAEIGVFLLLFSIGLELSTEQLSRSVKFLLVGGPVQMLLVAIPTALLLSWLGWTASKALLIGATFSFSSTVLVFKSLGELGGVATRSGRGTIAILLFQDAALIPLLLGLPLLIPNKSGDVNGAWVQVLQWLNMGLITTGFIAGTLLFRLFMTHIAIPRIMKHRSPEIVVLLAIVVLGVVTLIASRVGLPAEVGAFAAGVILGGTRWAEQIDTLILPFREVFSAIFFVSLGLLIEPEAIFGRPLLITGLILGLILLKIIAALIALQATGLSFRGAIGPALGLAHVGEFAFVLIVLASTAGVVDQSERQIAFAVAGGTLLVAPLLIRWGFQNVVAEPRESAKGTLVFSDIPTDLPHAIIIGMGPIGRATASQLNTMGYQLSCVDLNPLNLQAFAQEGVARVIAGDAESADCLNAAGIGQAKLVIICIPQDEIALRVTGQCRTLNAQTVIIVRCRYVHTMNQLRSAGATHVISEEANAAKELVKLISVAST